MKSILHNKPYLPAILLIFSIIGICLAATDTLPKGWFKAGNAPQSYESGIDHAVFHSGKGSGYLQSKSISKTGFGTLMQMCQADEYIGKRIRFSAYVKSENVKGWSGVWLRIDGPDDKPLGFDNMQERPIKGTTDWKKYDIVLDVPKKSVNLAFGILLQGEGKVWIDDLKFEVVDNSVPTTKPSIKENTYPEKPVHLDFED